MATLSDVSYKYSSSSPYILQNVNCVIPENGIFALLGPSGSGKTSLLKIILRLLVPSHGSVSNAFAITPSNIGYNPQNDDSLHHYFKVREMLSYCARMYRIINENEAIVEILRILELTSLENKEIRFCSGGQKRRVSLACAFLHAPKYLILDEPTVGLDPVLRRSIWQYLTEIKRHTCIILTTHYSNEATQADTVAFLRFGRILALGSPQDLMRHHASLQEAVYQLCLQNDFVSFVKKENASFVSQSVPHRKIQTSFTWTSFKALNYKNITICKRHKFFMGFQIFLPLLVFAIFISSIGGTPVNLNLSVVNEELTSCQNVHPSFNCPKFFGEISYISNASSCHFLSYMDSNHINMNMKNTFQDAQNSVISGESHGILHFKPGFSKSLSYRLLTLLTISHDDHNLNFLNDSFIKVSLDNTNIEISRFLQVSLQKTTMTFLESYIEFCHLPFKFSDGFFWIYDSPVEENSHNMLAPMMTMTLYFLSLALTADLVATEKESGVLSREILMGTSLSSIILSALFVFSFICYFQVVLTLTFIMVFIKDLHWGVCLTLFICFSTQSIVGMSLGILLSSCASSRYAVIQGALAIIFPTFILTGILWPQIGLPRPLQILSSVLPSSQAAEVIRQIIHRNEFPALTDLFRALGIPGLWLLIFLASSLLCLKRFLQ